MGGKANKWGAIAAFGSAAVLTALLAMLCASPFAWPIAVLAVALFASSRWLGSAAARLAGIGDAAMPAACVAALREGREDEALQALSAAPAGSVLHPLAELSALRTAALAVARQALHAECAAHAASRAALAPLQARQDDDAGRLGKASNRPKRCRVRCARASPSAIRPGPSRAKPPARWMPSKRPLSTPVGRRKSWSNRPRC